MEMRQQTALLIKINSKKNSKDPKIAPVPVPVTALQRLKERWDADRKLAKHDSLVRRLLGNRAKR